MHSPVLARVRGFGLLASLSSAVEQEAGESTEEKKDADSHADADAEFRA